jgi:L-2-hydroxyglutarate oxidase LhgO
MNSGHDVLIVGAGIVGLATAREILLRTPGTRLAILEKEPAIGGHQTGHNSGVIHSGIYYAPGSLRSKLCVAGASAMYDYCAEHGLPNERCGKLIVALDESELPRLEELFRRGSANGVQGLEMVGPEQIKEREPACAGIKAIWSPNTGIADYGAVAVQMAKEIAQLGGEILTNQTVAAMRRTPQSVLVTTTTAEFTAERVLTCAGLYSDRIALLSGASSEPQVVPFRGDYWQLRDEVRGLVRNLIYPVPDPSFPFLGVHFTRRITDGAMLLGPNAVLAFAREGYRRSDFDRHDLIEAIRYRGFRQLARKYWRTGAGEIYRDYSKRAFFASCQRFLPDLSLEDLVPGPSGVRAQSLASDGVLVDDFHFDIQGAQFMHVRNAPSPAATASLAIGQLITDKWQEAAAA